MENDGEARELLLDLGQDVESQWRRNENAVHEGALLGSELVSTMRGTDGDSQRVAASLAGEVDNLLGLGIVRLGSRYLVLHTCQHTELCLYGNVMGMGILYHLLGEGDVLLVGKVRTVNHDRRETVVDAVLAQLEAVTVVEVQHDLGILAAQFLGILHSTLGQVAQDGTVGIVAGTLRYLHDDGRLALYGCHYDGLHLLHGVEVEGRNSIATSHCLGKHFTGVHQTQFFVTYHNKLEI